MTTQNNTLDINILRALALMQHKGEDFFITEFSDVAYEGESEGIWDRYKEDAQTGYESGFKVWCEENLIEVAPFDPDDYNNDYLVLTDEEAEEKWEESLNSYIEECIQPELDKLETLGNLSSYIEFDEEMWKRDARMDGRGHSLSGYDGSENEETINGETFYIYRQN